MAQNLATAIVTFNCAREIVDPDAFATRLIQQSQEWRKAPDIVFLSLQEVAPIAHSFLGGSFLRPYLALFGRAIRLAAGTWLKDADPPVAGVNVENGQAAAANSETAGDASEAKEDATYTAIAAHHIGMTAALLFVRNELMPRIRYVETAGTGLGLNEMGNKGCVGVRIGYAFDEEHVAPVTFLAAHLAPHEYQLERRNEDWRRIVEDMVFVRRPAAVAKKATASQVESEPLLPSEDEPLLHESSSGQGAEEVSSSSSARIYGTHSYTFLAGDLNYRTASERPTPEDAATFPRPKSLSDFQPFESLLSKDQLNEERDADRTLHGFQEASIRFPPTYKYSHAARAAAAGAGSAVYADPKTQLWAAGRWPSWCDRILLLDETVDSSSMEDTFRARYASLPLLPSSDHQSVSLYVELPLDRVGADEGDITSGMDHSPYSIKADHHARRTAARRQEVAVGALAYVGWTWEGNALMLATLVGAWGGWALIAATLQTWT